MCFHEKENIYTVTWSLNIYILMNKSKGQAQQVSTICLYIENNKKGLCCSGLNFNSFISYSVD